MSKPQEPSNRELAVLFATCFAGILAFFYLDDDTKSIADLFTTGNLIAAFLFCLISFFAVAIVRYTRIPMGARYGIMYAISFAFIYLLAKGENMMNILFISVLFFAMMVLVNVVSKLFSRLT